MQPEKFEQIVKTEIEKLSQFSISASQYENISKDVKIA